MFLFLYRRLRLRELCPHPQIENPPARRAGYGADLCRLFEEAVHFLQQRHDLRRRKTAGFRRAGAGRERRVETVDIQRKINRRAGDGGQTFANRRADVLQLRGTLEAPQVPSGKDQTSALAHILADLQLRRRPNPKLHGERWVYQAFSDCFTEPSTMSGRLSRMIGPRVAMRVEVDQSQRPPVMCATCW